MEHILYGGRGYVHPAGVGGLADWTITVGSVSKEYRMIGWRFVRLVFSNEPVGRLVGLGDRVREALAV